MVKKPLPNESMVKVFRNNILIITQNNDDFLSIAHPEHEFWRVEIYKNNLLWIVSGQIFVP
ncbi:MAG: hypothetical protein Q8R26_02940 [bacterium]|nr:hypothetical protein [bacterium]